MATPNIAAMSTSKARRVIIVSMIASAVLLVAASAKKEYEFPPASQFLGLAMVFVLVGFLAEVNPRFAALVAVLVVLAVALNRPWALGPPKRGKKAPKPGAPQLKAVAGGLG